MYSVYFRSGLFYLIAGFILLLPGNARAQQDEDKFPIKGCGGRAEGICLKGECKCEEWQIELFDKSGKVWGLITGKTLESVRNKLKKSQDFDRQYARFFGKSVEDDPYNHQRPGKPICRASCPATPASRRRSEAQIRRRDEIEQAADDIIGSMFDEIGRVTGILGKLEKKGGNPFRSVGSVLKDYANALRDVIEKQKELREKMTDVMQTMDGTMAELEAFLSDLQATEKDARSAYDQLPENARKTLETGEVPAIGGDWKNHRVRGFDNSVVVQTIDFNQNRVTVSQKSTGGGANVSYNLTSSDILPQTVNVQGTDVPDRWMVTFNTNGRKIIKTTDRESDSLTDNVSKMTLFFSSEEAANAAAQAIRALP